MTSESEIPVMDCCHAWQADKLQIIPKLDDNHQPEICEDDHPNFFIEFMVDFHYPSALPLENENDSLLVPLDFAYAAAVQNFWARCETPPDHEALSWGGISSMLTKIGVPLHKQPFMLHRISACANEMAKSSENKDLKVLPMKVLVSVVVDYISYDAQDSTSLVVKENSDVAKLRALPAGEEAIEALGKKIFQDQEKGCAKKCMICLEMLGVGSEIMGMPCSHDYHKDCLLHWLKMSNFCPHCHFKLGV